MNLTFVVRFKVHPGRMSEFKRAAARCLEAARSDGAGTLAYEWFTDEQAGEVLLIEAYTSSEAVLLHFENAGPRLPELLALAEPSAEGLGAPSDELRELLQGQVTFIPRFQGLAAPTIGDKGGGSEIRAVAHFKIPPGKLADFKSAASQGLAIVAEKDPGTTAYEWYLDESAGHCVVVEMYRDADALFAHAKNVGHLVRALSQSSELSAVLCSNGTGAALAPLAKLPMKKYTRLQGLRA